MCDCVTILVPAGHTSWFEERRWPHVGWRVANSSCSTELTRRAGAAYRLFRVGKTCSCGWFVESQEASDDTPDRWKRMMKRGWSLAKARRALAQSHRAQSKRLPPTPGFAEPIPEIVHEVAATAGTCGIIAEWISSNAVKYEPSLELECGAALTTDPAAFVHGRLFWVTSPAVQSRGGVRRTRGE